MSTTKHEALKCGNCGGVEHKLFMIMNGERQGDILVQCCNRECRTKSRLTVRSELAIEWCRNQDAVITGGWSREG